MLNFDPVLVEDRDNWGKVVIEVVGRLRGLIAMTGENSHVELHLNEALIQMQYARKAFLDRR